jgi:hypothetical protein
MGHYAAGTLIGSELCRIPLPRTWVNMGIKKGRSVMLRPLSSYNLDCAAPIYRWPSSVFPLWTSQQALDLREVHVRVVSKGDDLYVPPTLLASAHVGRASKVEVFEDLDLAAVCESDQ